MKTFFKFFIVGCISTLMHAESFGQGFSLTSLNTPNPTVSNCDSLITIGIAALSNTFTTNDYNLTLNGSNFGPSQFNCTINWGDGTSSSFLGTTTSAGAQITWNGSLSHNYYTIGQYTISVSVTNPQNNSTVNTNLYFLHTACSGQLTTIVTVDCNNDGIADNGNLSNIPVNYTGATAYQTTTNIQGQSNVFNTIFGTYTASINPNWLASNNYVVSSASNTSLSVNGISYADTAYIILNCSSSAQQGMSITSLFSNPQTVSQCDMNASVSTSVGTLTNSTYSDFHLTIGGGPFSATQLSMVVNWGDGTSTVHTGAAISTGTAVQWSPAISHNYSNLGMYTIIISITNAQNGTGNTAQMYFDYSQCTGTIAAVVQLDCNNDGIPENYSMNNVPVIYSLNGVPTYYNNSGWVDSVLYGNYSVTIDSAWLSANNYVLAAGQYTTTINQFNIYDTLILEINCGSVANLCISGYLFCDANNNGVYNSGENYLANAPVQINNNGVTYTVYTNANGYYTLSYPGTVGSPTIVSLNSNWLYTNGYTSQALVSTVLAAACGSTNTFSIPVNCGIGNNPTLCAAALVFCDANANGMFDNNEDAIPFAPVTFFTQTSVPVTTYSDSSGFAMICGNYFSNQAIIAQINPNWLAVHGYTISSQTITIQGSTLPTPNPGMFAVNCNGTSNLCADLWTTVTPWIGYYQNTTVSVKLSFGNYGPGTASGATVTLTFPAGVTVNTSSINIPGFVISGNTITWNVSNLTSNYNNYDYITFNVPGGLASGVQHFYTSTITSSGNNSDCYTGNNVGNLLQIVGNSYDPNDKTVDQQQFMSTADQNNLTYNIRFQNTGTAPAQNIYILDTLSANLDWSTFELLEASHPVQIVEMGNGLKRFEFNGIWLPDSISNEPESHGNIVYRIKELASNQDGSEIFNTAYIFFDWNEPIITNTTYNINTTVGIIELNNGFGMAPNPASNEVSIQALETIQLVEVLNLSGQVMAQLEGNSTSLQLPVRDLADGVYLVRVSTVSGKYTKKLLKK